jgi:hypothetical protein
MLHRAWERVVKAAKEVGPVIGKTGFHSRRNKRRIRALKDANRGRRVFILGNGPSLAKTDLTLLRDEITIGSNCLFLLFDVMGFIPTYYTVEDVLVAEDRALAIGGIRGSVKVFPRDLSYCLAVDDETILINFVRQYGEFPKLSDNFAARVFWGGTVTMLNLQLAYYIGSREVYLLGMDHQYTLPETGDKIAGNIVTSGNQDKNHFHKDYFGPGFRYHNPRVDRMEVAYREAKRFFEKNGGKIMNATHGGKLEVFPRTEYKKLFDGRAGC